MRTREGIAIALSGGGFRATLFHAGGLIRLNELAILGRIDRFISVSGGSITNGLLAHRWRDLDWSDGVATNFADVIVDPVRRFCGETIDVPSVVGGAVNPFAIASDLLDKNFRRLLFGETRLEEITPRPRFIIQATNLATGRSFRFYREYMADYLIGSATTEGIRLSTAVTASCAFPPVLSPVRMTMAADRFRRLRGADLHGDARYTGEIVLSDGGVYDNLGLEQAWKSRTVFVSDAGSPFDYDADPGWRDQLFRPLAIATDQSRGLRKRWLVDQYVRGVRDGAYWGLTTRHDSTLHPSVRVDHRLQRSIAALRTRLSRFSDREQKHLLNLGYVLADAACRTRVPHLMRDREPVLPFPDAPLAQEE